MDRKFSIIYTHGGGRFGNQLLRFLHWLAWVQEHGDSRCIVNIAFWPYAEFFTKWARHPGCEFPLRRSWPDLFARARTLVPIRFRPGFDWRIQRLTWALSRNLRWAGVSALEVRDSERLQLDADSGWHGIQHDRRIVVSGWQITCWDLIEKHAGVLRKLFEPAQSYRDRAESFLERCREDCDVLVGLLMRQDDYRVWNEGRYFFSSGDFAGWTAEIGSLFPGQKVGIVVTSDSVQDEAMFAMPHVTFATGSMNRGGHWFESFLELAGCDLIVSPPSTFSACAAFLGEKPLMPLRASGQRLDLQDILRDNLVGAARDRDFGQAVR